MKGFALNKRLVVLLLAAVMTTSAAQAQYVRVGPPAPLVERPGPPLHPGWAWRAGYHRWDGTRYVWVPGAWVAPPRPRAVWIQGHWVRRPRGWVFIRGHWRYR